MLIGIAIATFVFTLIGGFVALRYKDRLHLILGFSAGAIVAVAFFDLLPEALELGQKYYDVSVIVGIVALAFFVYLVLDRFVFLHAHAHDDDNSEQGLSKQEVRHLRKGTFGVSTLCVHSFLDGMIIGLSFQISVAMGVIVAVAVLVHGFSDGINTVGLVIRNNGDSRRALYWLISIALAPSLGVLSTLFITPPEQWLVIILAAFCGFFLYIGATDLIPESHHAHPKFLTTAMTLLGAGVLYFAIQFAHV